MGNELVDVGCHSDIYKIAWGHPFGRADPPLITPGGVQFKGVSWRNARPKPPLLFLFLSRFLSPSRGVRSSIDRSRLPGIPLCTYPPPPPHPRGCSCPHSLPFSLPTLNLAVTLGEQVELQIGRYFKNKRVSIKRGPI